MTVESLQQSDFGEFFEQVHGYEPFGWQSDLLAQVVKDRRWPDLIDLPTGAGKTSVIDVAIFALAVNVAQSDAALWAPRRVVMVVDRRIVVDQAHDRATVLADALTAARRVGRSDVVGRVADALCSLGPDIGTESDAPLYAGLLRGGRVRDNNWALRPDRALVLSATVDQVGSRLLFRGYGTSDKASSIHAGLLGNDTLIILDEVHLSRPFKETLQQIARHSTSRDGAEGLDTRKQMVLLSATPGDEAGTRFPDTPLKSEEVEPVLARRLRARKPVRLEAVKVAASVASSDQAFAKRVAAVAVEELQADHVQLLGVVVNRVDTARRVTQLLEADRKVRRLEASVELITGRMRPIDRDALLAGELSGWSDRSKRKPVKQIVVATQCVEAGADIDFDGLVTECASIDALRQRFGRVDRRGDLTAAGTPANGVVLLRGENAPEFDAVYGTALASTWSWLAAGDPIDFGIEVLPAAPADCTAQRSGAPVLTRVHLRAFSHTSPRPTPDHVASRWLHGDESGAPNVSIIWRSEICDLEGLVESIATAADRQSVEDELTDRLGFCPPLSRESIDVPIYAARAWLDGSNEKLEPISDTESMVLPDEGWSKESTPLPWVLWRDKSARLVGSGELRPGDTVIVPTTAGGIQHRNWDPTAKGEVPPVAQSAALGQRNRLVRLLGPPGMRDAGSADEDVNSGDRRLWQQIQRDLEEEPDETPEELIRARFAVGMVRAAAETLGTDLSSLPRSNALTVVFTDGGFIGVSHQMSATSVLPAGISGSHDDASFTGAHAYLDEHVLHVGEIAAQFARNLRLPERIVQSMRLAGELHDLGKLDPRFQSWLAGGGVPPLRPIAKSARSYQEAARRDAARQASGYPKGARHEMLSLVIAKESGVLDEAVDPDLVAHLVASHHGHARPFAPPVPDPNPVKVDARFGVQTVAGETVLREVSGVSTEENFAWVGSGIAARFDRLSTRYGEHGLAWMEAIFRLADHRRSEWETGNHKTEDRSATYGGGAASD